MTLVYSEETSRRHLSHLSVNTCHTDSRLSSSHVPRFFSSLDRTCLNARRMGNDSVDRRVDGYYSVDCEVNGCFIVDCGVNGDCRAYCGVDE